MNSLSGRYIRIFLLILVVPVFVSGIFLDLRYFSRLRDASMGQMQDLTDQLAGTLDTEIIQIQIMTAALVNNADFLRTCEEFVSADDDRTRHIIRQDIDRHLEGFFSYTNKIGTVYLFFNGLELYYYHNYPTIQPVTMSDRSVIATALNRKGLNHVIPSLKGVNPIERERPLLSIAVSPGESFSRNGLEALMVSFRIPVLDLIDQGRGPAGRSPVLIAGSDGRQLLAGPGVPPGALDHVTAAGLRNGIVNLDDASRYMISTAVIDSTGWQLFRLEDHHEFLAPLRRSRWVTYASFSILSVLFIVYTLLFFRGLLRPLSTVIHRMSIVERGDYSVSVPVEGPREIARLGTAFNRMISEVSRLTREVTLREAEKNRYEMEALQYRIHPHFVANTLNSIRLMAEAESSPHIAEMSASLMRLMSEGFNKGGRLIALSDEIRNLDSYIHIMKVRFGEIIDVSYDIPESLDDQPILKMLMQPLVENSVLHGIRESQRPGRIEVAARLENDILTISVADNGIGADPSTLRRHLRKPTASCTGGFSGIGVYNVHRRIRLNYGSEYGLELNSRPGEGTMAVLRLPGGMDIDD